MAMMDISTFDEFWLSDDEYNRRLDYLLYSFEKIEDELFDSFDILPLREENLNVSSMFYADFCIRTYPIITIGLNLASFGNRMKETIDTWFRMKDDPKLELAVNLDELHSEMDSLHNKFKTNTDTIRDYYRFFKNKSYFIFILDLGHQITLKFHVGKIESEKGCRPFEKNNWEEYLNVRNSIVHRGKIEATQEVALNSVGCLYTILFFLGSHGMRLSVKSNIFGGFGQPTFSPYPYWIT